MKYLLKLEVEIKPDKDVKKVIKSEIVETITSALDNLYDDVVGFKIVGPVVRRIDIEQEG